MIKDLKLKQGNVELTAEVVDVGDVREFQKFGKTGRVANATLKDDSGQVKMSLWNEQIDKIKKGDRIQIKNGYVNEWQGEPQLTTGKFGTMEVLDNSSESASQPSDDASAQASRDEMTEQDTLEGAGKDSQHALTDDEKTEETDAEELDKEPESAGGSATEDEKKSADFEDENLDVEEENIE
ncbi:MAG: OB-fold nucleic acid binding domain-containing protein [Candidatus Woesearchaeota archaeon]